MKQSKSTHTSSNYTEKRSSQRVPVSIRVECQGLEPIAFAYAQDISSTGMALKVEYVLKDLEDILNLKKIHLRFILPNSNLTFDVEADIVRISNPDNTKNHLLGIQFCNLNQDQKNAFDNFVSQK